jgi:hypothetical protein
MALQSSYSNRNNWLREERQTSASLVLDKQDPETISSKDVEAITKYIPPCYKGCYFVDVNINKLISRNFVITSLRDITEINIETISTYTQPIHENENSPDEIFRGTFTIKHHYKSLFTKEVEFKTSELPRLKPHIPEEWRSLRDDE